MSGRAWAWAWVWLGGRGWGDGSITIHYVRPVLKSLQSGAISPYCTERLKGLPEVTQLQWWSPWSPCLRFYLTHTSR